MTAKPYPNVTPQQALEVGRKLAARDPRAQVLAVTLAALQRVERGEVLEVALGPAEAAVLLEALRAADAARALAEKQLAGEIERGRVYRAELRAYAGGAEAKLRELEEILQGPRRDEG